MNTVWRLKPTFGIEHVFGTYQIYRSIFKKFFLVDTNSSSFELFIVSNKKKTNYNRHDWHYWLLYWFLPVMWKKSASGRTRLSNRTCRWWQRVQSFLVHERLMNNPHEGMLFLWKDKVKKKKEFYKVRQIKCNLYIFHCNSSSSNLLYSYWSKLCFC